MNWWISWHHYEDDGPFEYHGPWWITGAAIDHEFREKSVSIVAAITAPSEDEAWTLVQNLYDEPLEDIDRRFIEPLTREPFTDRFQRAGWMKWPVEEEV